MLIRTALGPRVALARLCRTIRKGPPPKPRVGVKPSKMYVALHGKAKPLGTPSRNMLLQKSYAVREAVSNVVLKTNAPRAGSLRGNEMLGTFARKWFLVDARIQPPGRIASVIQHYLTGKYKPVWDPSADVGDHVVVVNAGLTHFTGRRWRQKTYFHHTGYARGVRLVPANRLHEKKPTEVILRAVKGMLPHNRLRKVHLARLHLHVGMPAEGHPHRTMINHIIRAPRPSLLLSEKPETAHFTEFKESYTAEQLDDPNFTPEYVEYEPVATPLDWRKEGISNDDEDFETAPLIRPSKDDYPLE